MRRLIDLTLYLVLDPFLCGGADGMVQTAKLAAQSGATCIQLRAPGWHTDELIDCGRAIRRVLTPFHVPLIVNNDPQAALSIEADGLHVGQSDMPPRLARKLLGEDAFIGLSVTCFDELNTLDPHCVDYAGVGPVFSTTTKTDAAPALGLDEFERITHACPVPVVAIGGIGLKEATLLRARGANGIAVVSAICGQKDVCRATTELKNAFCQLS